MSWLPQLPKSQAPVGGTATGLNMIGRVSPWMPGSATSPGANEAIGSSVGALGKLARDPYGGIPKGILYRANEGVEGAYQGARGRTLAGAAGAGIRGAGVTKGILGNLEYGRGAGMADATRAWDELRTKIGDERLSSILLPFLGEQWGQHAQASGALLGQPKKQDTDRSGNFLSGLLGTALSYYGGGSRPTAYAGGDPTSDYYSAYGGMG